MTEEQLNKLANEYSVGESPLAKSQAEKVAYKAGFQKALEIVFNQLDAPLYTHYDYDAALKPLLDLYDSLINKP